MDRYTITNLPREYDIVRYKNCTTTYRLVMRNNHKLYMHQEGSNNVFPMPSLPRVRLVLVKRDKQKEKVWDTSGFDALKSAESNDDSVDAMRYATHGVLQSSKTSFKKAMEEMSDHCMADVELTNNVSMDMNKAEEVVRNFHNAYPRVRDITNKLNGQGQGGRDMSIHINSLVAKVTDNIKDAELVTRYFGHELVEGSIKDEYFVRDNYESLLKEAQDREEKRLADIAKSCA